MATAELASLTSVAPTSRDAESALAESTSDSEAGHATSPSAAVVALDTGHNGDADVLVTGSLLDFVGRDAPPLTQETIGGFLSWAELLGRRTSELHVALARTDGGAAISPEAFTRLYQRSLYQSMRSQARSAFNVLRKKRRPLDAQAQANALQLLNHEPALLARFADLLQRPINASRIRCHGDLHLGQILVTGKDFAIIDFEGEPQRPISESRIKASPLRDVAGMLRSFHYVAHAAMRGQTPGLLSQHGNVPIEHWAAFWYAWVSAAFLRSYLAEVQPAGILPTDLRQLQTLLECYLLEKALSELRYELDHRPDWVDAPLEGILHLLQ